MGGLKHSLSHILWIGGATDAGKTSIARLICERHGLQLYNYDRTDLAHHQRLAESSETYREFLNATLEERWVLPQPEALVQRAMQSFVDRWSLVIEDLLALPKDSAILAEGFGLMPDLVAPVIHSKHQAVWLVPSPDFKAASMSRRNKPSFASSVSDPERARRNVLNRDLLLAEQVKLRAQTHGLTVLQVDGTLSIEEMAAIVEDHFNPILAENNVARKP